MMPKNTIADAGASAIGFEWLVSAERLATTDYFEYGLKTQ